MVEVAPEVRSLYLIVPRLDTGKATSRVLGLTHRPAYLISSDSYNIIYWSEKNLSAFRQLTTL